MKLYHYTCSHAAPLIARDRWLKTNPQIVLGGVWLVWMTDLDQPDRSALGLTSHTLKCDRTEHRAAVVTEAERWSRYARTLPLQQRRALELAPGARPMHWWVSETPVPILSIGPTS